MAQLLLVDDDNDIVEALGDLLLREEGHEVHSASAGEEGLMVLRGSSLPDALVLDVDIPVLVVREWLTRGCCTTRARRWFRSSFLCRPGTTCLRSPGKWNVVRPQETDDN